MMGSLEKTYLGRKTRRVKEDEIRKAKKEPRSTLSANKKRQTVNSNGEIT